MIASLIDKLSDTSMLSPPINYSRPVKMKNKDGDETGSLNRNQFQVKLNRLSTQRDAQDLLTRVNN